MIQNKAKISTEMSYNTKPSVGTCKVSKLTLLLNKYDLAMQYNTTAAERRVVHQWEGW